MPIACLMISNDERAVEPGKQAHYYVLIIILELYCLVKLFQENENITCLEESLVVSWHLITFCFVFGKFIKFINLVNITSQ